MNNIIAHNEIARPAGHSYRPAQCAATSAKSAKKLTPTPAYVRSLKILNALNAIPRLKSTAIFLK